jgi:hypothetical protein
MRAIGSSCLTEEVLHAAAGNDPVSSRVGREGLDRRTVAHLIEIFNNPSVRMHFGKLATETMREEDLVSALLNIATQRSARGLPEPPNLAEFVALIAQRKSPDAALAKAFAGLFALAFIEGLTRINRPAVEYPYFSLNSINDIGLPVARLLMDAGLIGGAAMLAMRLRSYMTLDSYQRQSALGRSLIEDLKRVEREFSARRHAACKQAAWTLRENIDRDIVVRAGLASVLFAVGDSIRAQAVATGKHVPALGVLVDLVEISVELAPVDPLLQAVWLELLLPAVIGLPEEVGLPIRMRRIDVNSEFKGADAAYREHGIGISRAYARVLFDYVTGLLGEPGHHEDSWRALLESLKLPVWGMHYRSGLLRVLELYSLAQPPGTSLPGTEMIAGFSGRMARTSSDLRIAATQSLEMDNWSAQRGQVGRSLAYDNAFLTEPWRRGESAAAAIDRLEAHRYAALDYWHTVVPPLLPLPAKRREHKAVEQDLALVEEYKALTFAAGLNEAPLHLRVYGLPDVRRIIEVNEGERAMQLSHWSERYRSWYERALKDFPVYAALRARRECKIEWVQSHLRTGLTW